MNVIHLKQVSDTPAWRPSKVPALKVGLVQINNSFSGQNYLPYTSACLRSYIEVHAFDPARYEFLPFIYKRMSIQHIVEKLKEADVVGFSTSVWNANISLEVARRLKQLKPYMIIVFGGPQVPDKPETYLRTHSFIDIVAHNEGERTFLALLERIPERNWEGVKGVSYIAKNAEFIKSAPVDRMKDLEQLPSPFLNGIFDQLIAENPNEKWIGLWETNRGCPFQCTFCDWGSATAGKINRFEKDRLFLELDWFAAHKIEYIFVCDANFGSQKRDIDIAQYVAELRGKTGYPQGFSVQSTKNATERAYTTQKILADAGLNKGVALSMQSLDPVTLENIKRDNISLETYLELARRFTRDKVETYSDLIIGLPGETYNSYLDGINTLINTGQHHRIQFNNLSILPNAEMGDPDYLKKYKMKTVCSEIINIHGSKVFLDDDIAEMQDIVIETYSMGSEDWLRTRAISWMISFLYFDKLVQLPIVLLRELMGISYKQVFETFMNVQRNEFPVLGEIRDFFISEARLIQGGGVEYKYSEEWLGVYWPADEYVYIRLTAEKKFDSFYSEIERLILTMCSQAASDTSVEAVQDAITLNRALVSQPYFNTDIQVHSKFNIIDFWRGITEGQPVTLEKGNYVHLVKRTLHDYSDFQLWCKEVVWWGNKKGAYLYSIVNENTVLPNSHGPEIAGHY
jgi:radical SAM superfamily enzyme YgiQ (UPF0313 family)